MKKIGCLLSIPITIGLTIPWLWFLWGAVTWQSWAIGAWGLALIWLPLSWARRNSKPNRSRTSGDSPPNQTDASAKPTVRFRPFLPLLVLFLGLSCVLIWQTPSRRTSIDSPISNQYAPRDGETHQPSWFSLPNIVPEKEQINLGFRLMPWVDPVLTSDQAKTVSKVTMQLYDELESDPEFRSLGSVLGSGYCDISLRPYDDGHYFLYVSDALDRDQPKPAIVFLHGSGGNFKPYIWLWSKLAKQEGYVIIAPTFGFGHWNREAGLKAVAAALEDAKSKTNIDTDSIYLAGLSNGGLGVSQVAANDATTYKGVIFLSPVIDGPRLNTKEYVDGWRGRPQLVITGKEDRRIPIQYVDSYVAFCEESEIDVTYKSYPAQDHFLFFYKAEEVFADINAWLKQCQSK